MCRSVLTPDAGVQLDTVGPSVCVVCRRPQEGEKGEKKKHTKKREKGEPASASAGASLTPNPLLASESESDDDTEPDWCQCHKPKYRTLNKLADLNSVYVVPE